MPGKGKGSVGKRMLRAAGVLGTGLLLCLAAAGAAADSGIRAEEARDAEGRVAEIRYVDAEGEPAAGPQGWARITYAYDSDYTTEMYYAADGSLFFTERGICGKTVCLEPGSWVVEEYYYTGEGVRGYCREGYSRIVRTYNRNGRLVNNRYYDTRNRLMTVPALGYAQEQNIYAGGTELTETWYFDPAGLPVEGAEGYAAVRYTRENGQVTEIRYLKADGHTAVNCAAGYARALYERDAEGHILSERFLDAKARSVKNAQGTEETRYTWEGGLKTGESLWQYGRAATGADGYHGIRYTYDENGREIRREYLDTDWAPAARTGGYAAVATEYNSRGGVMGVRYYSPEGQLMRTPGKEYACLRTILFADLERVSGEAPPAAEGVTEEAVGTDGRLMMLSAGYARKVEIRDAEGRAVSVRYYDTEGRPAVTVSGYAAVERTYGEDGMLALERCYGADGEPAACREGYDELRRHMTVTDGDPTIRTEYFLRGERVLNSNGVAVADEALDAAGLTASVSFYGTEGEKVRCADGYHRVERTWLDRDHMLSEAWFDETGRSTAVRDTYVRVRREYDAAGNLIVERYYGSGGGTVACRAGYDEVRRSYDEQNRPVWEAYFLKGRRVASANGAAFTEQTFDAAGLVTGVSYYGVREEPVLCTEGYHRVERTWLDRTHILSEAWFDTHGRPIAVGDTYVRAEREFDPNGNTVLERYWGPAGEPKACAAGYDEIRYAYDGRNRAVLAETFLNGQPAAGTDGAAVKAMEYDGADRVAAESCFGPAGEPVRCAEGWHRRERVWLDKVRLLGEAWFDTDGSPLAFEGAAARREWSYDAEGRVTAERWYGADGQPAACPGGYDALSRTWDAAGRLLKTEYFLAGARTPGEGAAAVVEQEYEDLDLPTEIRYYGADGQPVRGPGGWARLEKRYRADGLTLSEAWYDEHGAPVAAAEAYARVEREYDTAGHATAERYYGPDGKPAACAGGYDEIRRSYGDQGLPVRTEYFRNGRRVVAASGAAVLEQDYDDAGRVTLAAWYGTEGEPIAGPAGYHRIERSWADGDLVKSEAWFGTDGRPMALKDTYVKVERDYDGEGRLLSERYYGRTGMLKACSGGYDEVRKVWNEDGQLIRTGYYRRNRLTLNSEGYALSLLYYDASGLPVAEWFAGTEWEPVRIRAGYFRVDRKWLDADHLAGEYWQDEYLRPTTTGDTYVRWERDYDAEGRPAAERYYGADGKPVACAAGYEEIRWTRDEQGRTVRTEYRSGGQPALCAEGYAAVETVPDAAGLPASERYYGADGEPILLEGGYCRVDREWLDAGHALSEAWFGTDGEPAAPGGETYVRLEREFDANGNPTVERYYGADGQPVACLGGYDEVRRSFGSRNQVGRIGYFLGGERTVNRQGASFVHMAYDDAGRVTSVSYYGTLEEPVRITEGYFRVQREWLDAAHALSEAWFDEHGEPVAVTDTYARVEREFDENGNTVLERYFGTDGQPAACRAGYDEIRRTYGEGTVRTEYFLGGERTPNPEGAAILVEEEYSYGATAESCFGTDGEPVLCAAGWHRVERTRPGDGQVTESWFGTDGELLCPTGDTYVRIARQYDENWNVLVERYYGADWQPIACRAGYDAVLRTYNERNLPVRVEYYLNGRPAPGVNGAAVMLQEFDEEGRVTAAAWYAADGTPVRNAEGYHRAERVWLDRSHALSEAWFDENGAPVPVGSETYVRVEREFDANGNTVRERYYGADGKPAACLAGYDEIRRTYDEAGSLVRETRIRDGWTLRPAAGS